jgi:hypothetical protein
MFQNTLFTNFSEQYMKVRSDVKYLLSMLQLTACKGHHLHWSRSPALSRNSDDRGVPRVRCEVGKQRETVVRCCSFFITVKSQVPLQLLGSNHQLLDLWSGWSYCATSLLCNSELEYIHLATRR